MVRVLSNFKTSNLSCKNKNYTTNNSKVICSEHSSGDKITISKNTSSPSFTGVHGADWYCTQAEKDALSYKIQLTPEKINENIKSSRTADSGLIKSYMQLNEEYKHVGQGFRAIKSILNKFTPVSKEEFIKMAKMDPKGSNIPIAGFVPEATSLATGSFNDRLEKAYKNLVDDAVEISDRFIDKGLQSMGINYLESSQFLYEKADRLNPNKKNPTLMDILGIGCRQIEEEKSGFVPKPDIYGEMCESIASGHNLVVDNFNTLNGHVASLADLLKNNFEKVLDSQLKRQTKRVIIKGVGFYAGSGGNMLSDAFEHLGNLTFDDLGNLGENIVRKIK